MRREVSEAPKVVSLRANRPTPLYAALLCFTLLQRAGTTLTRSYFSLPTNEPRLGNPAPPAKQFIELRRFVNLAIQGHGGWCRVNEDCTGPSISVRHLTW